RRAGLTGHWRDETEANCRRREDDALHGGYHTISPPFTVADSEGTVTRPPSRLYRFGALAATFIAAAVAATWPLAAHITASLPAEPRDPLLNAWILAWDADRMANGLRGVWDAPILYPYRETLAFSEHLFGIVWLTAPIQWLWHNPILSYNCAFLFSYVLAATGMYLLVREITGRVDAAVVA